MNSQGKEVLSYREEYKLSLRKNKKKAEMRKFKEQVLIKNDEFEENSNMNSTFNNIITKYSICLLNTDFNGIISILTDMNEYLDDIKNENTIEVKKNSNSFVFNSFSNEFLELIWRSIYIFRIDDDLNCNQSTNESKFNIYKEVYIKTFIFFSNIINLSSTFDFFYNSHENILILLTVIKKELSSQSNSNTLLISTLDLFTSILNKLNSDINSFDSTTTSSCYSLLNFLFEKNNFFLILFNVVHYKLKNFNSEEILKFNYLICSVIPLSEYCQVNENASDIIIIILEYYSLVLYDFFEYVSLKIPNKSIDNHESYESKEKAVYLKLDNKENQYLLSILTCIFDLFKNDLVIKIALKKSIKIFYYINPVVKSYSLSRNNDEIDIKHMSLIEKSLKIIKIVDLSLNNMMLLTIIKVLTNCLYEISNNDYDKSVEIINFKGLYKYLVLLIRKVFLSSNEYDSDSKLVFIKCIINLFLYDNACLSEKLLFDTDLIVLIKVIFNAKENTLSKEIKSEFYYFLYLTTLTSKELYINPLKLIGLYVNERYIEFMISLLKLYNTYDDERVMLDFLKNFVFLLKNIIDDEKNHVIGNVFLQEILNQGLSISLLEKYFLSGNEDIRNISLEVKEMFEMIINSNYK